MVRSRVVDWEREPEVAFSVIVYDVAVGVEEPPPQPVVAVTMAAPPATRRRRQAIWLQRSEMRRSRPLKGNKSMPRAIG